MKTLKVSVVGAGFQQVFEPTEYKWLDIDTAGKRVWMRFKDGKEVVISAGMYAIIVEEDLVEPK